MPEAGVRITARGRRLHCFVPPVHRGDLVLPLSSARVQRAWIMGDRSRTTLSVSRDGEQTVIGLPAVSLDPICAVVVVELADG
ncbi:MAG TPA: hypothetical protein PLL69_06685, partial [Gemmatimonadales bacterium]|nr:hypothetical protein [Gemmatimonadales bacterium]